MKKLLLTLIFLSASYNTFAQNLGSNIPGSNASGSNLEQINLESFSLSNLSLIPASLAFIGDLTNIEDTGVHKYTSKYNGMSAAKVQVNKESIKLLIYKDSKDCSKSSLCLNATAPMVVNFKVTAAAVSQCHDSLYGISATNAGEKIVEEVVIQRFATERCQSLVAEPTRLYYRVSGKSLETGELGSAYGSADIVNIVRIPYKK